MDLLNDNCEKEGLNQKEAAVYLGVSISMVRKMILHDVIPYKKVGKRYILSKSALFKWVSLENTRKEIHTWSGDDLIPDISMCHNFRNDEIYDI